MDCHIILMHERYIPNNASLEKTAKLSIFRTKIFNYKIRAKIGHQHR